MFTFSYYNNKLNYYSIVTEAKTKMLRKTRNFSKLIISFVCLKNWKSVKNKQKFKFHKFKNKKN